MNADAGYATLWLAFAAAVAQLLSGMLALRRGGQGARAAVVPLALAQAGLAAFAFACLVAVFARTDLTVLVVA